MKREFVMTEWFDASRKDMKLSDVALRNLQDDLLHKPYAGDVIRETNPQHPLQCSTSPLEREGR